MGRNVLAALDIGSSKVSCIVFECFAKGKVKILSNVTKASAGVRCGVLENMTNAISAISSVLYESEKKAAANVKKVIVNISHPFISSKIVATKSDFGGRQVLSKDLKIIFNKALMGSSLPKHNILHGSLICYDVDDLKGIGEAEYMFAKELVTYNSIITCPKHYIDILKKCLKDLRLVPIQFVCSSYAASLIVDAKSLQSSMLIDIGEGMSDVMVFSDNNKIVWAENIPLGGGNITTDIAECFSVSYEEAEKIKILCGNLTLRRKNDHVSKQESELLLKHEVDREMLNKIIAARVEEMIELILSRVPKEYRTKQIKLTGGGASLLGLASFISEKIECEAEVVTHNSFVSSFDGTIRNNPAFSVVMGLVKHYLQEEVARSNRGFSLRKVLDWMWESF